ALPGVRRDRRRRTGPDHGGDGTQRPRGEPGGRRGGRGGLPHQDQPPAGRVHLAAWGGRRQPLALPTRRTASADPPGLGPGHAADAGPPRAATLTPPSATRRTSTGGSAARLRFLVGHDTRSLTVAAGTLSGFPRLRLESILPTPRI